MIEDLEQELTRAMAADVADLPEPRLDLHRIQHPRPARRLVVPGVAAGVALAVAAPLAAAKAGAFRSAPVANTQVQVSASDGQLVAPKLPAGVPPAVPDLPAVSSLPPLPPLDKTPVAPDACSTVRRTLTAAERSAAVRQLRASFDAVAKKELAAGVTRQVGAPSVADLARLLPNAGAMVTYFDCALGRTLPPEQAAAAVAEVRRAVADAQTMVQATRAALEQALGNGKLPSWLGDLDIHMVNRMAGEIVLRIDLGAPKAGWPASGSITVTIRATDRSVISIQPGGLKLPPGLPVPQLPATPKLPVSLPSLPVPVPLPPQVPGLPTS